MQAETIDMPLNEADKAWVRQEVHATNKRQGLGILSGFIKDWGGAGAAIAILAIFFTQWSGYIEFRTHTQDRLDGIEKRMTAIDLRSQAALPQPAFDKALPELRVSIASAKNNDLKLDSPTFDALGQKLIDSSRNAPEFWPTVSEFISYHSSSLVGGIRNWSASIPLCPGTVDLDSSPDASAQGRLPDGTLGPKVPIQRIGNQNCYVELDGKSISRWDCTQCVVKYSGGPLKMRDVHLKDCLFIFDFRGKQEPAQEGQRLSETLLASDTGEVSIPAS